MRPNSALIVLCSARGEGMRNQRCSVIAHNRPAAPPKYPGSEKSNRRGGDGASSSRPVLIGGKQRGRVSSVKK